MRENRPYGSEGGAAELNRPSLPLWEMGSTAGTTVARERKKHGQDDRGTHYLVRDYSRIIFRSCSAVSLPLRWAPSRRLSARSRLLACKSVMRSSIVPLVMNR